MKFASITVGGAAAVALGNLWFVDVPKIKEFQPSKIDRPAPKYFRFVDPAKTGMLCYEEVGHGSKLVFVFCPEWPVVVAELGRDRIEQLLNRHDLKLVLLDTLRSDRSLLWQDVTDLGQWPQLIHQFFDLHYRRHDPAQAGFSVLAIGVPEAHYAALCASGSPSLARSIHLFSVPHAPLPQGAPSLGWLHPTNLYFGLIAKLLRMSIFQSPHNTMVRLIDTDHPHDRELFSKHLPLYTSLLQQELFHGIEPLAREFQLLTHAATYDWRHWPGRLHLWTSASHPGPQCLPQGRVTIHETVEEGPFSRFCHHLEPLLQQLEKDFDPMTH